MKDKLRKHIRAAELLQDITGYRAALYSIVPGDEMEHEIIKILITLKEQYNDLIVSLSLLTDSIKRISVNHVKSIVCKYYNISIEEIDFKTRKREIVKARQIAMYFCKALTKTSLATIGHLIGKKDHATVIHACKTVNDLLETDNTFRAELIEIKEEIKDALK